MSMNIPSERKPEREFTLNQVNSLPDEPPSDIRSYCASSLHSFAYERPDSMHEDKIMGLGAVVAVFSGLGAMNSMGIGSVINGLMVGAMTGAAVGGTGILGLMVVGAIVRCVSDYDPELASKPINTATLDEKVFKQGKESGIMPNKFIDPISLETIKTPVAFSNDPTGTIYDLKTVKELERRGVTRNPLGGAERLDFSKLVYLPEVKKQIDEIKKMEAEEI